MALLDFYLYQEQCQRNFLGDERNPRLHNQTVFGRNEKLKRGQEIEFEVKQENNNYVGKKKETHNIVGLEGVGLRIDLKLFYTVRDYPLCGLEKPGRLGHIAS